MLIWRRVAGVVAGLGIAFVAAQLAELVVHEIHPPPPDMNMRDFEQVKRYVGSLPVIAYVVVLFGWLLGTVGGAYVAIRIAQTAVAAYIILGILTILGSVNAFIIPQPWWFSVLSLIIYLGGPMVAVRLAASSAGTMSRTAPFA